MKYVSLDIETTSLSPSPNNILMISMIVEDTENLVPLEKLPHFTCFIKVDSIQGTPYALGMNGWILDIISGRKENTTPYLVLPQYSNGGEIVQTAHISGWEEVALKFLNEHFGKDRITLAGKNVGSFDLQFLPHKLKNRFRHRCIDPGSIFLDWKNDTLPSLGDIKKELELGEEVAHDAYEDALDVIKILRTTY